MHTDNLQTQHRLGNYYMNIYKQLYVLNDLFHFPNNIPLKWKLIKKRIQIQYYINFLLNLLSGGPLNEEINE